MFIRKSANRRGNKQNTVQDFSQPENLNQPLTNDLDANLLTINNIMGYASDVIMRKFNFSSLEIKAAIITIKGLSERELINEQVLTALTLDAHFTNINNNRHLFKQINQHGIPNVLVTEETNVGNIVAELISGNTIFFMDGIDSALIIGSQGWKDRSVSEPTTENVVRGPKDGFT